MITQTYTRPRRAAVSPAAKAVGPVTKAIRGLRPNEMPSWEMREQEMRRQEAADLRALRRRVAKAVAVGIDFLDATQPDADAEPNLGAPEVQFANVNARFASGKKTAKIKAPVFARGHGDDDEIDADIEQDGGEEAESVNEDGGDTGDDEPSLAGITVNSLFATGSAMGEGEQDAGDEPEEENEHGGDIQDEPHDGDERELDMAEWGVGDADGLAEVLGQVR